MDVKSLINYLCNIYQLEVAVDQQRKLLEQMENERETLKATTYESNVEQKSNGAFLIGLHIARICAIPVLLIAVVIGMAREGMFLKIIVVALLIIFVPCLFIWVFKNNKNKKQYEIDIRKLEEENMAKKAVVEQRVDILLEEILQLKTICEDTEVLLNDYYNENILYYKYKNAYAVAKFIEYLSSGRCSELQGKGGAYNLYEKEVEIERMRNKLTEIMYTLKEISQNQQRLREIYNQNNREFSRLTDEIGKMVQINSKIELNSAMTAYNSRITAQNTDILKWIKNYKRQNIDVGEFANNEYTPQLF